MIRENFKLKGRFQIYEEGVLVIDKQNFVTIAGANVYANLISGDNSVYPQYLGIDGGAGSYSPSTPTLNSEVLRKLQSSMTSPSGKSVHEFILDGNEAIGQLYGFGLNTEASAGIYTNLVNITYYHQAGKKLKIVWSVEVAA
jgi:hypothetical protein